MPKAPLAPPAANATRLDRQELLWLLAVMLIGASLRLYGLGARSLWYDEVEQMAAVRAPWADLFNMVRVRHLSPPLDFILMRPFVALGQSDAWARAWSAFAGILAIPAIFLWARAVAGKDGAKLAALLLATSSFAIAYAQEARMYSSFLLFTLLSFYALDQFQKKRTKATAVIYGLVLGAVFLTHYFGAWLGLLQAPWLLWSLKKELGWPKACGLAAISWVLALGLFLPWLPSFLVQLRYTHGAVGFGMPFKPSSFISLLEQFSSGRSSTWFLGAAFVFAMVQAYRRGDNRVKAVAWIALGGMVLPLAVSQFKPNVAPRYLIYFLAPFYLVVASGIAQAAQRLKHGLLLAGLVLLAGQLPAALRDHAQGINAFKPRWHEAADLINADPRSAPVAVDEWTDKVAMGYYIKPWENHFWPQLSEPLPPKQYRVLVADDALVQRAERGEWQGWVVVHFGVNRAPGFDPLAERVRKVAGPPKLHLPSPNESNGVDVYYCGQ